MSPDNAFTMSIVQRIAQKLQALDDPRRPQAQPRSGARMVIQAYGLATDQRPLAPEGQPESPVDRDLMRLGFEAGQRYPLHTIDDRLKARWPDDVETRLSAKLRLEQLGMVSDGWTDPRAQQPGGPPATGVDRLQARGEVLRDRRGEPIVLRSRPA
jgi:hypothetical protein